MLLHALVVVVGVSSAQATVSPAPAPSTPTPVGVPTPVADAPVAEAPAALTVPPLTVEPEPEAPAPAGGFVKGELSTYLGSDRLVVRNTRVGVSAGLDRFAQAYYLTVAPMLDLRFLDGKLGLGFIVPLRLELVNFANGADGQPLLTKNLGHLRTEDWNSVHDFGRVLNYVTYGKKEDPLYVSAGQRYASSLGHGAIQRRYAPNIDTEYPRASAEVDAYNRFGGFELFTNDLLAWNLVGGIGFLKPFSFFSPENLLAQTLSVGVTYAMDWQAPWQLTLDPNGVRQLDTDGRLLANTRGARLLGFDAEVKVVKTAHVDLKPYLDYSTLLGGDGGFTAGVLGRFNVGTHTINAFRVVAEFRAMGSHYVPAYFDTFYEVERFIHRELPRVDPNVARYATKLDYVLETGLGQRMGYYGEVSWGIPDAVGLTLAAEGVSNAREVNLIAHLEVPVLSFVQLFGSYYLRGLTSLSELGWDPSQGVVGAFGQKAIAFAGARVKLLPFLFINGRAYKTFRMNPELQRYDNQLGFVVDLEIGYEFKKSDPAPPTVQVSMERGATAASDARL
jgi:hypothetical protein